MKLFLLLIVLVLSACKPEPVATPPDPPDPADSPSELQFAIDDEDTRFTFYNRDRWIIVKSDRADVPGHLRPFTMVLLERTPLPKGAAYLWEPGNDTAQMGSARRIEQETMLAPSLAAWAGRDLGEHVVASGISDEPIEVEIEGLALDEPPPKSARRRPAQEKVKPRKIEIVGITDSLPQRSRTPSSYRGDRRTASSAASKSSSASTSPSVAGTRQWKQPVTVYYEMSCGRCQSAMRWMDQNGVSYRARSLADANEERRMRAALGSKGGSVSLPVIVIGNERKVMTGWNSQQFTRLAQY